MKYLILYIFLIFFTSINSCKEGKQKKLYNETELPMDSIIFNRKLPVYKVKACLKNLLEDIAKENLKYFNIHTHFYKLSFRNIEGKKYMVINTTQYKKADEIDFTGAVKLEKGIFLCRGDFANDSLFTITGEKEMEVNFIKRQDLDDIFFGSEPSLRGLFQECGGDGISIEVYIAAELPKYGMDVIENKN